MSGNITASGEVYNDFAYATAHKFLLFGTLLTIESQGHSVCVRVNGRRTYMLGCEFDLSGAAADALSMKLAGVVPSKRR